VLWTLLLVTHRYLVISSADLVAWPNQLLIDVNSWPIFKLYAFQLSVAVECFQLFEAYIGRAVRSTQVPLHAAFLVFPSRERA